MSELAIYEETISIKAAAFHDVSIKASIDKGTTLTKISFVTSDNQDVDRVNLRCLTFLNEHFVDALTTLKKLAQLPREGGLHATGVGVSTYRNKVKEMFGLDTTFIAEAVTMGYGPFTLINNCDPEDIFYPIPDFKAWTIKSELIDNLLKQSSDSVQSHGDKFPALIIYVGSGCAVLKIEKDGKCRLMGGSVLSGRPFIGLAHALIGTTDYDEIMRLAEKGDYLKADMTTGDLLDEDPDSPYGQFPRDMPMFPFGRAAKKSWNLDTCSREDLAMSLVRMLSSEVGVMTFTAVSNTGLNRVYLSGNFFRHELSRKFYYENIHGIFGALRIDAKFLKTGNSGALAAMVLNPEDCANLM